MATVALISTTDPAFLAETEELLRTKGEILVELRYSGMAGSRDVLLFHSFAAFRERLASLSPPTMVKVCRRYSLPLRGLITEEFIQAAQAELTGAAEYLIVYLQPRNDWRRIKEYDQEGGWLPTFQDGRRAVEMEVDLRDTLGEWAAVGAYPEYSEASGNRLWAVVPEADGSLSVGTY